MYCTQGIDVCISSILTTLVLYFYKLIMPLPNHNCYSCITKLSLALVRLQIDQFTALYLCTHTLSPNSVSSGNLYFFLVRSPVTGLQVALLTCRLRRSVLGTCWCTVCVITQLILMTSGETMPKKINDDQSELSRFRCIDINQILLQIL